jgi:hypothetical protein
MSTTQVSDAERTIKGVRRVAIWTVIISLVITALIGIYTIVGGEFGETQSKVMLTTLAVAGFSILALCHLAVFGRDVKVFGWVGIGTSGVALGLAATLIWWDWWDSSDYMSEPRDLYLNLTKSFAVSALVAVSLAHANLMLLLQNSSLRWIRTALSVALVFITIVPALVIPVLLTDGTFPPMSFQDVYWRFFGVILILDALATIALPVTTLIVRSQRKSPGVEPAVPKTASAATINVSLSGVNAAWVKTRATETGTTADQVITALIAAARKK